MFGFQEEERVGNNSSGGEEQTLCNLSIVETLSSPAALSGQTNIYT